MSNGRGMQCSWPLMLPLPLALHDGTGGIDVCGWSAIMLWKGVADYASKTFAMLLCARPGTMLEQSVNAEMFV